MNSSLKLLAISILLVSLLSVSFPTINAATEATAIQAINQSEDVFASAYETVLETEQAGANVSVLLDRLNIAGENLAEAQMLLRLGNFDAAVHSAELSSDQIDGTFMNTAEKLKNEAQEFESEHWFVNVITSIVALIAAISGTSIAWIIFKRRHFSTSEKDKRRGKTE